MSAQAPGCIWCLLRGAPGPPSHPNMHFQAQVSLPVVALNTHISKGSVGSSEVPSAAGALRQWALAASTPALATHAQDKPWPSPGPSVCQPAPTARGGAAPSPAPSPSAAHCRAGCTPAGRTCRSCRPRWRRTAGLRRSLARTCSRLGRRPCQGRTAESSARRRNPSSRPPSPRMSSAQCSSCCTWSRSTRAARPRTAACTQSRARSRGPGRCHCYTGSRPASTTPWFRRKTCKPRRVCAGTTG